MLTPGPKVETFDITEILTSTEFREGCPRLGATFPAMDAICGPRPTGENETREAAAAQSRLTAMAHLFAGAIALQKDAFTVIGYGDKAVRLVIVPAADSENGDTPNAAILMLWDEFRLMTEPVGLPN